MTDDRKPTTTVDAENSDSPEPRVFMSGSTITAFLFAVPMTLLIVGAGTLNILAALGGWNPFHWRGHLWTGIFMIAAPGTLGILAALPFRIRSKMPHSIAGIAMLLCWVAFFWAACGGH